MATAEPPPAEARGQVLLELGLVETSTDGPAAGDDLQAAYETLHDDEQRATAALALTRTLVFVGEFGSPVRFAARALATLPSDLVEQRAAVRAYQRIAGQMHGVDPSAWQFDAEPPIPGDGYGSRMLQATVAYERMCRATPRAEAVELAAASLADGQLTSADPGLLWVWSQVVLDLAEDDAVMANWDAINAEAHRRGSLFSVLAVGFWRAWSLMRRGDLYEAEQSIRAGLEQLDMWQANATTTPYGQATLARILFDQGRRAEAWAAVGDQDRRPTPIDGDRLLWTVRAEMLLAEGHPREALRLLDVVVDRCPQVTNPAWRGDRLLRALAVGRCGAAAEGIDEAERLVELARTWGAPGAIAEALLVLGLLRGADGVDELRQAVELLRTSPRRVLRADALLALGSTLAGRNDIAAVEPLHEAHRTGIAIGAARVTDAATSALQTYRLPAVEEQVTSQTHLTAMERTVLQLIESGASVHEVGQKLFLTPTSVERHLDAARRRRR